MSTPFALDRTVKPAGLAPDSVVFADFPVFARAGMQFESHLGHSIPPRQRGFCFNVCTLTLLGSL